MTAHKRHMEQLYRPKEVGRLVGVSPRTVVVWIKEGKLRGVKVGRVWRVPQSEIEKLLDGTTDDQPEQT